MRSLTSYDDSAQYPHLGVTEGMSSRFWIRDGCEVEPFCYDLHDFEQQGWDAQMAIP